MIPAPEFTSSTSQHYVSAADFAEIYNIDPVYSSGISGAGEIIAVVGFAIPSNSDTKTRTACRFACQGSGSANAHQQPWGGELCVNVQCLCQLFERSHSRC